MRQSLTQSADADTAVGRGSPYTTRSMTGGGMLLVRGLPLRVGWRPMRHGQKGVCVIACMWAAVRTWCGGEMSTSNAMLLRFASEVPYGFRGRQRFFASKALSSHIKAVFAPMREQHTRGRTSLPGLAWCGQE